MSKGITPEQIEYLRDYVANPRSASTETFRAIEDLLDAFSAVKADYEECRETFSAFKDALNANERTKSLHIGEYYISLNVVDEDGEEAPWSVPVPWTTLKDIMAAIRFDGHRLAQSRLESRALGIRP